MIASIEQFQQRFTALSQREKLMVIGTALTAIWGSWDHLLYQSIEQQQKSATAAISQTKEQLRSQEQIAAQLEAISRNDPNLIANQQLTQMRQSVDKLKLQLDQGGKKFVSSQSMASALRDMLKQHGNLKLIKLETLPVSGFGNDNQQPIWVYRHAMSLTLQGDYFSTLAYLKALETLPWRIQWDSIDYQVQAYPLAQTQIQVYTLSFEQDWLDV